MKYNQYTETRRQICRQVLPLDFVLITLGELLTSQMNQSQNLTKQKRRLDQEISKSQGEKQKTSIDAQKIRINNG